MDDHFLLHREKSIHHSQRQKRGLGKIIIGIQHMLSPAIRRIKPLTQTVPQAFPNPLVAERRTFHRHVISCICHLSAPQTCRSLSPGRTKSLRLAKFRSPLIVRGKKTVLYILTIKKLSPIFQKNFSHHWILF